jgi:hypothetical protein
LRLASQTTRFTTGLASSGLSIVFECIRLIEALRAYSSGG